MARKNTVAAKTLSQKNRKSLDENIQDLVTDAINKWKAEYDREVAALKTEIQEIKASQEFVSNKYDSLKQWFSTLFSYTSLTNTNTVSSSPTKITDKQLLNYLNSKTYFWDKTKTLQKNIFTIG